MKSSLGFHTMTLALPLNRKTAERLVGHFWRYQEHTGLIKMHMVKSLPGGKEKYPEYRPRYNGTRLVLPPIISVLPSDGKDYGIRWTLRCDSQNDEYSEYTLEARINPKILGGVYDYITAANCNDMYSVEAKFNCISRDISPLLRTFDNYMFKRIDYCINFSLNELAPGCTSEQVMALIRRGDIPPHYKEWTKYNKRAHRMKASPDSFYLMSRSANINCYRKSVELQTRMVKERKKEEPSITQATVDEAQDIIRFEVQCKYPKVYALSRQVGEESRFIINKYRELLGYQACMKQVNHYYKSTIGAGDWFSMEMAQKIIRGHRFHKQKRERLIEALREVSQCRSLASAKAKHQGSDLAAFKRTLKDLADIGINPVTIPREWGISHIPNLLHTFNDKDDAKMFCPDLPLI